VSKKPVLSKTVALPDFEAAFAELEKIVEKMESGEQSLEEALKSFQRGIELTRLCQQGLKDAEQRVEKLIQENDVQGRTNAAGDRMSEAAGEFKTEPLDLTKED
jgi:exodeoxyribonuclease VII small subunit